MMDGSRAGNEVDVERIFDPTAVGALEPSSISGKTAKLNHSLSSNASKEYVYIQIILLAQVKV
jgi:hypothetical protein